MKPRPLFCSFFTPAYADEAAELAASLDRFDLAAVISAVPDLGSWQANTRHKPTFLRSMREKYPRRPLVWLDADARVVRKPSLEWLEAYDLGVHYFGGRELASGTVYLGPSHESYELCRRWEWRCERQPELSDQQALQVEAEAMPGLAVFKLPASLCFIDGLSEGCEPVIFHRQASRVLR